MLVQLVTMFDCFRFTTSAGVFPESVMASCNSGTVPHVDAEMWLHIIAGKNTYFSVLHLGPYCVQTLPNLYRITNCISWK